MRRRVVITGIGLYSSLGQYSNEVMDHFRQRRTVFTRPAFDPKVVVSPITSFDVKSSTGAFKEARYLNRGAQLAVASAVDAVKNAELPDDLIAKAGLFTGVGPNLSIGDEFPEIRQGRMDRDDLQALWILRFLPNTAAAVIARLAGIRGENLTVSTACASSLQAIGEAFRRVKDGYLNSALAGGGDSRLSAGGILAYRKARAVYAGDNDSDAASRPFDADRAGFVPGEGGGFFLLEESAQARKRGARIYAEVCGYGSSLDGAGLTAPASDGREAKAAVLNALAEAQITPTAIEMISAHGTGTPLNDKREADMIDELFGERRPPVTALKSWIGHAATGCGAVELSLLLYCMKEQYLPEIRNLREPCHQRVHFVRESGPFSFGAFLIENFGFGGQNAALVIRQAE